MALDMRNMRADLVNHVGHELVVVTYGAGHPDWWERGGSVCIECETCGEVLIDSNDHEGK